MVRTMSDSVLIRQENASLCSVECRTRYGTGTVKNIGVTDLVPMTGSGL